MNWYKRTFAATLPMDRLEKAIRGTFKNMIPNIGQMRIDRTFANIEEGDTPHTSIEARVPIASPKYPIIYHLTMRCAYSEGTDAFDTAGPSDGMSYDILFGVDMQWTNALLEKYPHMVDKVTGLVEEMNMGKYSGINIVYTADVESIFDATVKTTEFMSYFEGLLDKGWDGNDGDEETDPWFPGDPKAEWRFDEEEDKDFQPARVGIPDKSRYEPR